MRTTLSRIHALLLMSLLAAPGLALAGNSPTLSSDVSWQKADDKGGVALYSRTRVGASFKEFKGTGMIDAPTAAVEKVLNDVPEYPHFMPYITEARVISTDGADTVVYQKLNMPMISDRDYTIRVEHSVNKTATGATIFRDAWQTANEAGPAERHGTVRVKVNEGSWLLEPAGPGGSTTQATYQIYTDSGGAVPAFMANRGSQMAIPRVFEAIRKQVTDPKYKADQPAAATAAAAGASSPAAAAPVAAAPAGQ